MKPLLFLLAAVQPATDECPVFVSAAGYAPEAAAHSRAYAQCMFAPSFPTEQELGERRQGCAQLRARQVARALEAVQRESRFRRSAAGTIRAIAEAPFRWIDHIASTLPGCETNVRIEGDGSEPFDAES